MKLLRFLIVAANLSAIAIPAKADQSGMSLTGADFLTACTKADMEWISFCNGYVQAVFDGVRRPGEVCAPPGTTRTKFVEIAVDELMAKPELRKLNAASAVYSVLQRAYPCR